MSPDTKIPICHSKDRPVVNSLIKILKSRGIDIPKDKESDIRIMLEVYGHYADIYKVINSLIYAETDADKLKAVKAAYTLQMHLMEPE